MSDGGVREGSEKAMPACPFPPVPADWAFVTQLSSGAPTQTRPLTSRSTWSSRVADTNPLVEQTNVKCNGSRCHECLLGDCDLIWSSGDLSITRERRPFQAEGTASAQAPRGREPPRPGWLEWRSPCGVGATGLAGLRTSTGARQRWGTSEHLLSCRDLAWVWKSAPKLLGRGLSGRAVQ